MKFSKSTFISDITTDRQRKAIPLLTSTGIDLIGALSGDVYKSGKLQADCIEALVKKFPPDAIVTFMDLSVEAEAFGCEIAFSDDDIPTVSRAAVSNVDDIENLKIPEVGSMRTSQTIECAEFCAQMFAQPVFGGIIGPYSLAGRLADMTEMMMMTAAEPEAAHKLLLKVTSFLKDYLLALKQTGIAGVVIAEPAAGLLSPEMCKGFSADYIGPMIEQVKDDSFMVILHNCGYVEKQIEAMLSANPDALHIGNSVDILDILPQVPLEVPVMGNLDPVGVFRYSDAATVYEATASLLVLTADYPNFVLSTGCDVPSGVPQENIAAFYKACNDYNKKFNITK